MSKNYHAGYAIIDVNLLLKYKIILEIKSVFSIGFIALIKNFQLTNNKMTSIYPNNKYG